MRRVNAARRAAGSGRALLVLLFLLTLPLVTPRVRGADEIQYFSTLRSLVFDGDLDFANEYRHFHARDPEGLASFKTTFLDLREPGTGRHINFGPLGSALLWAPFYLLAHVGVVTARGFGATLPADGFSWPYEAAVCYGSALYAFAGLLLAHDALRRFGSVAEPFASWSVGAVWLATPVLYYTTVAPAFSHACSLFAVALLVWLWLRARGREVAGPQAWALVGAAAGLAALVREQDLLYLLAPAVDLLWRTLRRREWRRGTAQLLAMGLAALAAFLPQLAAYHALNGSFGPSFYVRRKMDWSSPHFIGVLFDPAHGLFLWSPLLLLATAGLLWSARRGGPAAPMAIALLAQVWINGAVASWTLAGAFGARRFLGATVVFAWGLASLLAALQPRLGTASLAATLLVAVWWNASLIVQFGLRLMDRQRLEWPRVAVNQFTEVPARIGRAAVLYFTDRERLVREGR